MSAEVLRDAARLMRERAEVATPGPWEFEDFGADSQVFSWASGWPTVDRPVTEGDARHIASWHPAVALAVADWLDAECDELARRVYLDPMDDGLPPGAIAVARAYLGEQS